MFVKFLRKYGDHMKKVSQRFLFIDCDTLLTRYLRCQYSHSRFVTGHLILTWTLYHVTAGMCKYFSPALPRAPTGLKPYNSSFVFVRKLYICHQITFSLTYTLPHLDISLLHLSNLFTKSESQFMIQVCKECNFICPHFAFITVSSPFPTKMEGT